MRGKGTYIAFDSETVGDRDKMIARLKQHGIIQGFCGDKSTRFRPSLYFEKKHADIYLDRLEKSCSEAS